MLGLVAILATPWVVSNQFYLLLAELVGISMIVVTGLNLVLGYGGQVSLGHAALFGVGAYASALVTLRGEQGFVVGALAGAALAGLVGVLLGVPSLRLAGAYLAMATMAFNLIVQRLLVNWVALTGGPDGLVGIPPASIGPLIFDRRAHFYLVAVCAGLVTWLSANLVNSSHGRALLAVREDELAASSSGVAVYRAKLGAFGVSAVYAGLAGSLFAHLYRHISPASFGLETSLELLLAVLLGGAGSLGWPLVGAAIVTVLPQLPALQALQDLRLLVYGGLLLGSVALFRGGLAGVSAQVRARWQMRSEPPRSDGARWSGAGESLDEAILRDLLALDPGVRSDPLELRGASKRFGGVVALDGIDLTLEPGSIHGLIGPNGSGKTTALNVASGQIAPDSGLVRVNGRAALGWPARRFAALGVARTFQSVRLFGQLSVLDNVLVGQHRLRRASLVGCMLSLPSERSADRSAVARAAALGVALGLGPYLERRADDLAHGLRRRVELARALALRPRWLLLDEPGAGLGDQQLEELATIVSVIKSCGVAVLLVEHQVDLVVRMCDRVTVLQEGRVIAAGAPLQVVSDPLVQEAYVGRSWLADARP